MRRIALALALAALAGCEREPAPLGLTGEQLQVHSLLVAGSDTAHVLLTRTLSEPIQDPTSPGGQIYTRPVSAADVRLVHEGRVLRLREAPEGFPPCSSTFLGRVARVDSIKPGCYAGVVPGGIRPGERYRLEVRLNGGVAAEGSTRVPGAPEISSPAPAARIPVDPPGPGGETSLAIRVRYRVPATVAGVRATLALGATYSGGRRVQSGGCSFDQGEPDVRRTVAVDSLAIAIPYFLCFRPAGERGSEVFVPDSIDGVIALAGFDSTYTSYARAARQESASRDRLQAGVSGALGVFAGGGVARVPVTLVPRR